ncbi:MAG: hypothetical protein Q8P18_17440 [Pseudomonadota bacterium]|nr:hypothetical protein [Pseudomonadota bacterium]
MRSPLPTLLLALLLACDGGASDSEAPVTEVPSARCGDGTLDSDEACDDGADNDDLLPDACRTTCLLPSCGDAVVDAGEGCDDGGALGDAGGDTSGDTGETGGAPETGPLGGDGCSDVCAVEPGALEVEPNDAPAEATPLGDLGHGALPADDVDCWSFSVAQCGALRVTEAGPCGSALTMALYAPDGSRVAAGAPGADGCAVVDPVDQPGARWVEGGDWAVCVQAVNGGGVPGYTLDVAFVASADLDAPLGDDLDADGEPDSCDADRDGDGVLDLDDTCPDVSNGPDTVLALGSTGYVRTWLAAGPFTGDPSADTCRPAEEVRVGEDAADFAPTVGDPAGVDTGADIAWRAHLLTTDAFDFNVDYATVDAPREGYAMVYLWSDTARALTLAVGADDGVFAWWNDTLVLDVASCQGVNADQFQAPVDVIAGWNTLLLKVRDQGGGWGHSARLLDEAGGAVTDLAPALDPAGLWRPDQTDTDGDGVGDACDDD